MESQCRMCGKAEENIFHVIAACPHLSSNLYLEARHSPITKVIYDEVTSQSAQECSQTKNKSMPPQTTKIGKQEIWWDYQVTTTSKVKHNRPDMIIWAEDSKECKVIMSVFHWMSM